MSKKVVEGSAARSTPRLKRSRKDYPVPPAELDRQQARLKKAAAAGQSALEKRSVKVEFPASAVALVVSSDEARHRRVLKAATHARASATPSTTSFVNVSFVLLRPGARQVCLCGEFNNWSPEAGPMIPHEDGRWEAIVALPPGRYQYKFYVDGEWLVDPIVKETVMNEFGSLNSVIEIWL